MATGTIPKSVKATLYIDGKPAEQSIKSVEQTTRSLERELKTLTIGTDQWNAKMKQVGANKSYLADLRKEANGLGGAFTKIKTELGSLGTLAVGYLGFQFITTQFQNIIGGNAKLSDSLADMRRVIGLTEAGVLNLDSSLGKLDTRTSKSGLREIAVIAGKLGVAKNGILSFVEATDKLVVSLGDELGNADQVTTQLGKILNVFEGEVTGDNITRLGNAMVKLANDGVASAGFIADFTQRVSGIAKTAGLSLSSTLALGAGIEELGGRSESSATAIQKLLLSISSDTPKAAKIAGVSLKEFNQTLGSEPQLALLQYTKGLVANKSAFTDVTKALDDAGEEGARTIETITKLGQNTDFFTGKINDAAFAITGYNEINDAFNLKNQTLGAQLDKLGKDFNSLAANTTLVDLFTRVVQVASDTVRWFKENTEVVVKLAKVVVTLTAAWLGYRAAAVITTVGTIALSSAMATARIVSLLYSLAIATMTGNVGRAAAAQRLLGLSMVASPFGAVLAVVAALSAAYVLFSQKATTASKIQDNINNIKVIAKQRLIEEKEALQEQLNVLKKANATEQEKITAITQLRALMPDHLKGYTDVQIKAGKATDAVRDYTAALEERYLAEAALERNQELRKENIALASADGSKSEGFIGGINEAFQGIYAAVGYDSGVKRLQNNVRQENQKKIDQNNAIIKENTTQFITGKTAVATVDDEGKGKGGGGGGGGGSGKANANKTKIDEAEKFAGKLLQIGDDLYLKTLEKDDQEIEAVRLKYVKLREEANGNKDQILTIQNLEGNEMSQLLNKQKAEKEKLAKEEGEKIAEQKKKDGDFIYDVITSDYDKEVNALAKKFEKMLALADEYGISEVDIYKKWSEEKRALSKKETEEQEKKQEDRKKKAYEDVANDISNTIDIAMNRALGDVAGKADLLKSTFASALSYFKETGSKAYKESTPEEKLMKRKEMAIAAAKSVTNAIYQIKSEDRERELSEKLSKLDTEREAELEAAKGNESKKKAITARYAALEKAEKIKTWEANRDAAITQALINGALATTNIWATTPKVDFGVSTFIMMGLSAAATIASVGAIASQKPPKFATGGFSNQDPAGYVSSATMFANSASGRPFIAGEAGKEWIAPNWMLTDPRFAGTIGNLEMARKDKRAFAAGGFNGDQSSSVPSTSSTKTLESLMMKMIDAQNKANDKQVILSMRTFEEEQAKRVAVRNGASG